MFARRALQAARPLARSFSAQPVARKDFIQELYVKELKAYKPTSTPAAAGATKSYSTPSAPKAPEVPSADQLAKELAEYDAAVIASDSPAPVASGASAEETDNLGADDYLKLVEADVVVEKKH
ncbi:ATP synthase subunit H [Sporobolomyces koalae]|uniref:ATP synthase subunit H n=1 Tax=Sporobolomyces koalae TaxID=500713 RepID=UPI0031753273